MNKTLLHAAFPALRLFAMMGLTVGIATAQSTTSTTATETKTDAPQKLEAFEVTGSRIKRIDAEGPLPVIQLTRENLEITGHTNVGDVIRNLSFNAGGSIDPQRTSTFATGARTLNLRGLGSRNTLILINGRRVAGYGLPGGNGFDNVVDLNSLPASAIEAVEILKDGASAIYGSDAVAGVVNVKLRKDYSGFTSNFMVGNTTTKDALFRSASIVTGATSAKSSITATADWSQQAGIKLQDREYSKSADLRRFGGTDGRSSAGLPGRVGVPGRGTLTFAGPTSTPTSAGAVPYSSAAAYDFNPITDLMPEYRSYGFYMRGQYDFSPSLYSFVETSFRKHETDIVAAAAPVFGQNEQGASTAGQMLFPSTNPFNPFGVDIAGSSLAFRLVELGGRSTKVDVQAPRVVAGLGGKFGDGWSWEAAALYSSSEVQTVNYNQALDNRTQAALLGVKGPTTGRTLYLNPFGPNDPELLQYLNSSFNRNSNQSASQFDATVTGPLLPLPAGNLQGAFGVEARNEKLASYRSTDERTGNVIGGSEGFSTFGQRRVQSVYAEVDVPITKQIESQIAIRNERYSDFGSATKPKIGLSYKPTNWLLIRGSFSQAFKAPDLAHLYNGGTVTFSSANVIDTRRPSDPARQLKSVTVGNPTLKPENTNVYYGGFVFEPKKAFRGVLDGFTMSFDYFRFAGKDALETFGSTTILRNELVSPTFGSRVVRATPTAADIAAGLPGALLHVLDGYQNVGNTEYRGWDLAASYELKTQRFGTYNLSAGITYLQTIEFDGDPYQGTFTYPHIRGNATLSWRMRDWSANLYVNHVGDYEDANYAFAQLGGNGLLNRVSKWVTYTPSITYRGFAHHKITLGASNVLNTNPPRAFQQSVGYDNLNASGMGRFVYLQVTSEF